MQIRKKCKYTIRFNQSELEKYGENNTYNIKFEITSVETEHKYQQKKKKI